MLLLLICFRFRFYSRLEVTRATSCPVYSIVVFLIVLVFSLSSSHLSSLSSSFFSIVINRRPSCGYTLRGWIKALRTVSLLYDLTRIITNCKQKLKIISLCIGALLFWLILWVTVALHSSHVIVIFSFYCTFLFSNWNVSSDSWLLNSSLFSFLRYHWWGAGMRSSLRVMFSLLMIHPFNNQSLLSPSTFQRVLVAAMRLYIKHYRYRLEFWRFSLVTINCVRLSLSRLIWSPGNVADRISLSNFGFLLIEMHRRMLLGLLLVLCFFLPEFLPDSIR